MSGKPVIVYIDDLNLKSATNVSMLEWFRMHKNFGGWWFPDYKWYEVNNIQWIISCDMKFLKSKGSGNQSNERPFIGWKRVFCHCATFSIANDIGQLDSICSILCAKLVKNSSTQQSENSTVQNYKTLTPIFLEKIVEASSNFHTSIQKEFSAFIFDKKMFDRATRDLTMAIKCPGIKLNYFLGLWKDELFVEYSSVFTKSREMKLVSKIFNSSIQEALKDFTKFEDSQELSKFQRWYFDDFSNEVKLWKSGDFIDKLIFDFPDFSESLFCVHESFEYDLFRVCKILRQRISPLILTGPCQLELRTMLNLTGRLLKSTVVFTSLETIKQMTVWTENVIVVLPISIYQLRGEIVSNGPRIWDFLLNKIDSIKDSIKDSINFVLMVESSDRHKDSEWLRLNKRDAAVIHSGLSSKLSLVTGKDIFAFQEEHPDVIPALLSLYYHASSVWNSTLGIFCVPQQFRRALESFQSLQATHTNKLKQLQDQNERLHKAVAILRTRGEDACKTIKNTTQVLSETKELISATELSINDYNKRVDELKVKKEMVLKHLTH